jgi:hypothetical protein
VVRPVGDEQVQLTANLAQLVAPLVAAASCAWAAVSGSGRTRRAWALLAFPGRAERAALQARSLLDGP